MSLRLNSLIIKCRKEHCLKFLCLWGFLPAKCSDFVPSGTDLMRQNILIDLYEIAFYY